VIDQEFIKVFVKILEALLEVNDKVVDKWTWMWAQGYTEVIQNLEDCREGTSTGAEKRRQERRQVIVEDTESLMDIEDSKEDGKGSEVEEVVEGKGKGKEKEKEMDKGKGSEENTVT
jgi:hypothetical protein